MKSSYDCDETKSIVCPYCYKECEDDRYNVANNSANWTSFTCEHCCKDFNVTANVEVTYTSVRVDENDNIIAEWMDLEEGDCKYGCIDCIFQDTDVCKNCIDQDKYDDEDK